jgi:DNA-binding XRE family transcriptional regulator
MKLRDLRKRQRLSQVALAELAGVTNYTILNIEKQYYRPSTETISAVANALQVDPMDVDEFRTAVATRMIFKKPPWRKDN